MAVPLLRLQGVSKYYTGEHSVVLGLNSVNLTLSAGEFVAVSGESGSGKSTLTHILAGVLPYESGEMFFNGKPTSHYDGVDWERYRCENIALISQSYGILPGATVWSNVLSALYLTGMSRKDAAPKAEQILKQVELWDMRKRRAAKLSSGQKQRLSVARALAKPAPILLADEPTGNLDPENSAKVIRLLAEAAKERLVILITHEFSEAEALATRHIVLQDGRVIMDAPLREPNHPEQLPAAERSERQRKTSRRPTDGYVARLQMRARPVWSAIMLLFFALTALSVFVFLGTFITQLDDNSTRIYDNTAFRNGDMRRIIVQRVDKSDFSDADFAVLAQLPYIENIERYGYVTDVEYSYRENIDFYWYYSREGDPLFGPVSTVETLLFHETGLFLQTAPADPDGFLTEGRMPKNFYEVVSGDASLLGKTFPIYLRDKNRWGTNTYASFNVTVVGVTDRGPHLFVHDDMGRMLQSAAMRSSVVNPAFFGNSYAYFAPDSGDLKRYDALLNTNLVTRFGAGSTQYIASALDTGDKFYLNLSGTHDSPLIGLVIVSEEVFRRIVPQGYGNQVSLTIEDYAYTDQTLALLEQVGYVSVSPYRTGSQKVDDTLATERVNTLKLCLIVLVAVLLLQIVVLRALFSTQTENYRLLSNIGLSCREAKRSVLWQFLLFTLFGQLIGFAGIFIGNANGIERIAAIVRYITVGRAAILSATHLIAALIAAGWVMRSLRKTVYPFSLQQTDLNWKPLEEVDAQ